MQQWQQIIGFSATGLGLIITIILTIYKFAINNKSTKLLKEEMKKELEKQKIEFQNQISKKDIEIAELKSKLEKANEIISELKLKSLGNEPEYVKKLQSNLDFIRNENQRIENDLKALKLELIDKENKLKLSNIEIEAKTKEIERLLEKNKLLENQVKLQELAKSLIKDKQEASLNTISSDSNEPEPIKW